MTGPRRVYPLDVVGFALALFLLLYLLVVMPGYHWSRSIQGGFVRRIAVVVTVEVNEPVRAVLARQLKPGPMILEVADQPAYTRLLGIDDGPDDSVRLRVALTASIDGAGRISSGQQSLRRGAGLRLTGREDEIVGTLVAVDRLNAEGR